MQQHNMTTAQNPNPTTISSNKKILIVPVVLLALLLLFNLAQWAWHRSDSEVSAQKIDEKEVAYAELMANYAANKSLLDSLKTRFPGESDLFAAFDRQLAEKEAAIRESIAAKNDLRSVRAEIRQMAQMRDGFILEIAGLKEKVGTLTQEKKSIAAERDRAIGERDQFASTLEQSNSQLETEKGTGNDLALEKQKIERERLALQEKLEASAWLSISGLDIKAVSVSRKGKERGTKSRKAADRLKVCFSIVPNQLVGDGEQRFEVQVTGPDGTTFYVESKGSGVARERASGTDFRFSTVAVGQYRAASGENSACAYWEQPEGVDFPKGEYLVAVYHKGNRAGGGKLKLK